MSEYLLEVNHLSKSFESGSHGKESIPAVRDVSFHVKRGECLGIVGESGCGKSTIARLVTLLTPADSGEICLNGAEYTHSRNKGEIYRQIQMVFQDPYSVFSPRMQIGTFLEDGLVYFRLMPRSKAAEEAVKLMHMVDLSEELLTRFPHQLSGGQLQRVVIARAISVHPSLIILDEATSALDVSVQKQILELLKRLKTEQKLTYIFIGHDLAVVKSISDRIHIMYAGTIVEELRSDDLKRAVHPYSKELLNSIFSVHDRHAGRIQVNALSLTDIGYEDHGCQFRRRCPFAMPVCAEKSPKLKKVGQEENHTVSCFFITGEDSDR